jgi:hypothetical protein
MPSPFPGMDPFLEACGLWNDFHGTFIHSWRDAIMAALPDDYVACTDERLCISELAGERAGSMSPDITVSQTKTARSGPARVSGGAVLEPEVIPVVLEEETRETFIEIHRVADERLVTVIELLSPSNKDSRDRSQYLAKRNIILRQEVHLVKLDLLLGGQRLPMQRPLPPAHYYAIVSRWDRRPDCEVYHWTLDRPLPAIPIPLAAPDPDLTIDLAQVFTTTFERGRYDRSIKYGEPLSLPVAREELAWIQDRARQVVS